MGLGGISFTELLIVFLIVIVIFGTKRVKDIGADLGGAIKGFRKAMGEADSRGASGDKAPALTSPVNGGPDQGEGARSTGAASPRESG